MQQKLFGFALNHRERIAFRIHLAYSVIEGIVLGVLALNEFVFIKSINGKPIQLAFLFQFSMLVFLLSIFANKFFKNRQQIKILIRRTALITRLPMAIFLMFPSFINESDSKYHIIFLGVFLLYYLANPLIYPNINFFLKNSYQHQNFGFLYSVSTSANKIIMMIVTFIYGLMLDADPMIFRYVLPVIGLLTISSAYLLTLIPYKTLPDNENVQIISKKNFIGNAFKEMYEVFKNNKAFLLFQIAFMFYGLSFMIGSPSVNIFYKEILNLNYISVAFYRNIYNIIAIVLLPAMGKMLDNIGPMRFGIITFLSLMFYFIFLMLTGLFPSSFELFNISIFHVMIFALVFHGLFASTMSLLWNIGSAYFGKNQDAAKFQNIHLFLTGIRAIPGPIIGVWIYVEWGYLACFSTSVFLLIIGVFVIKLSLKTE